MLPQPELLPSDLGLLTYFPLIPSWERNPLKPSLQKGCVCVFAPDEGGCGSAGGSPGRGRVRWGGAGRSPGRGAVQAVGAGAPLSAPHPPSHHRHLPRSGTNRFSLFRLRKNCLCLCAQRSEETKMPSSVTCQATYSRCFKRKIKLAGQTFLPSHHQHHRHRPNECEKKREKKVHRISCRSVLSLSL